MLVQQEKNGLRVKIKVYLKAILFWSIVVLPGEYSKNARLHVCDEAHASLRTKGNDDVDSSVDPARGPKNRANLTLDDFPPYSDWLVPSAG